MKKLGIRAGFSYILLLAFVMFIPTKNLYFLLEQNLYSNKISINEKDVSTFLTHTSIDDAQLYFEDIKALTFKVLSLKTWLLYNSVSIDEVVIDEALKDFLPLKINNISAIYTLFYPHKVILYGDGDFGHMSGDIDLFNRVISIRLDASDVMKTSFKKLLSLMKIAKTTEQKNRYTYEYSF